LENWRRTRTRNSRPKLLLVLHRCRRALRLRMQRSPRRTSDLRLRTRKRWEAPVVSAGILVECIRLAGSADVELVPLRNFVVVLDHEGLPASSRIAANL